MCIYIYILYIYIYISIYLDPGGSSAQQVLIPSVGSWYRPLPQGAGEPPRAAIVLWYSIIV